MVLFAGGLAEVADRCHLAAADADIGLPTASAGTVDHGSIRNYDVIGILCVDRKSQGTKLPQPAGRAQEGKEPIFE